MGNESLLSLIGKIAFSDDGEKTEKGDAFCKTCQNDKRCNIDWLDESVTNIYRTPDFIVNQQLSICEGADGRKIVMSRDTYYPRTDERDHAFDCVFDNNGRRMRTAMFTRTYIVD